MAKTTGSRPSQILGISQIGFRLTGMPDDWAAINFDLAVSWFGHYVEARLNEYDDKTHKPLHRLEDLLAQDSTSYDKFKQFAAGLGVYRRKKQKTE